MLCSVCDIFFWIHRAERSHFLQDFQLFQVLKIWNILFWNWSEAYKVLRLMLISTNLLITFVQYQLWKTILWCTDMHRTLVSLTKYFPIVSVAVELCAFRMRLLVFDLDWKRPWDAAGRGGHCIGGYQTCKMWQISHLCKTSPQAKRHKPSLLFTLLTILTFVTR